MLRSSEIKEEARSVSVRAVDESPQHAAAIMRLFAHFERSYADVSATKISDVFELCETLNGDRRFRRIRNEEVRRVVLDGRKEILEGLIDGFYDNEGHDLAHGDTAGAKEIRRRRKLAHEVSELIALYKCVEGGDEVVFGVKWLQMTDNNLYQTIRRTLLKKGGGSGLADWGEVVEMLPQSLRGQFVIDQRVSEERGLLNAAKEYEFIAKQLGPEIVAEFLISNGLLVKERFSYAVKVLREYLGEGTTPMVGFGDAIKYPKGILGVTSIRRLLFGKLRNYVYKELIKGGNDSASGAVHSGKLDVLKAEVKRILAKKVDVDVSAHMELFDEVMAYFEEVIAIRAPERMVSTLNGHGDASLFPSLRQKIAMKEMATNRRQLISFFMSTGKTAAAYLAKEHVGAKKMLFVCPQGELVDEMEKRVNKYYKPGQAPSVGVIKSGMCYEQLEKVLEAEVVIFPYTMLKGEVKVPTGEGEGLEKKAIVDVIKDWGAEADDDREAFDYMTIDEVHLAKKLGGMYTEKVFELVEGIPGLYDEGYIASLSGDPTPNSPTDIVPQLRIYDKEKYGEAASFRATIRATDPLVVRNALLEYMLLIDPEYDWEQYLDDKDVDLEPEERKIYQGILNDDSLDLTTKRNMLYRCVLNPNWFVASGSEVKSAYLEALADQVVEFFEEGEVIVPIAEAHLKEGILRDDGERKSLATRLREALKARGWDVNFHIIDGDNTPEEREAAFKALKEGSNDDRKTVVFGRKELMGLGIDLSHINCAISTSSSFNKADDAQYVMRFPRGENKEARVAYMRVWDTVLEGYELHADNKYELTQILKHGGVLTEDDAALLDEESNMSETIRVERGKVMVGTAVVDSILSARQKLNRIYAALHGKGAEAYQKFLEDYGELFANLYHEIWTNSYGSNNARFVAGLWRKLEEEGYVQGERYLDAACGHLVLDSTLGMVQDGRKRMIFSLDLNPHMLKMGEKMMEEMKLGYKPKTKVGSISHLDEHYGLGQFSALNCSLAVNYTNLNTRRKHLESDERVATISGFNRVLAVGGIAVLTLPKNVGTREELAAFTEALQAHFGFEIVADYTGQGTSVDNPGGSEFENWVITCKKVGDVDLAGLDLKSLQLSRKKTKSKGSGIAGNGNGEVVEGVIHNRFKLKGVDFEFGGESRERSEQDLLTIKVDATRTRLRLLRVEHGGLKRGLLPADVVRQLEEDDIKLVEFGGSVFFQFMSLPPEKQRPYSVD